MAAMKAVHAVVNLKLHHAVASAQEDIATFVQDTSLQLDGFNISTGVSLGGLAIVAGILLAIVSCIFCRCMAARRATAPREPVMEMALLPARVLPHMLFDMCSSILFAKF